MVEAVCRYVSDLCVWSILLLANTESARHHCHCAKAGGVVASPVGERRSVRTFAQLQPASDADRSIKSTEKFWGLSTFWRFHDSPARASEGLGLVGLQSAVSLLSRT
jgi:hypothetical protein